MSHPKEDQFPVEGDDAYLEPGGRVMLPLPLSEEMRRNRQLILPLVETGNTQATELDVDGKEMLLHLQEEKEDELIRKARGLKPDELLENGALMALDDGVDLKDSRHFLVAKVQENVRQPRTWGCYNIHQGVLAVVDRSGKTYVAAPIKRNERLLEAMGFRESSGVSVPEWYGHDLPNLRARLPEDFAVADNEYYERHPHLQRPKQAS